MKKGAIFFSLQKQLDELMIRGIFVEVLVKDEKHITFHQHRISYLAEISGGVRKYVMRIEQDDHRPTQNGGLGLLQKGEIALHPCLDHDPIYLHNHHPTLVVIGCRYRLHRLLDLLNPLQLHSLALLLQARHDLIHQSGEHGAETIALIGGKLHRLEGICRVNVLVVMGVSIVMVTSRSIVHDAEEARDGHHDVNNAEEQRRDADLFEDG
mmetsp:Transcript_16699/g.27755  ORF Transcript_16699/g.27755 Transcript_16699/m.27755 type:complete len:210 (-) Transcript_16699:334-963(-)